MNDYEARAQLLYQTAYHQGYTAGATSKSRWPSFVIGVVAGFAAYWAVGLAVMEFVSSCFS